MAPLIAVPKPGVVKINSRYARRFSSVGATPTSSNRLLQVRLLSSIARRPLPGATMAFTIVARSCLFIGPLPIGNVWLIDAELVGVIFAGDLLVEQGLANTGAGDAETGDPIDSVNG